MTTTDPELHAVQLRLASLTGMSLADIEAMSMQEMRDRASRTALHTLAMHAVNKHHRDLANYGIDEQVDRATTALIRFHERVPLFPQRGATADLFGFGHAELRFVAYDPETNKTGKAYLLLSDVAEALAVPLPKAYDWAHRDHLDAIRSQRERDEERGDGRLGWECLDDLIDLDLDLIIDDPEAKPDHDGRRWSSAGDWLISDDRLLSFMTVSPWCDEFMNNSRGLFAHAFVKSGLADTLGEVPTYRQPPWDGPMEPTGSTLGDHFRREAAEIPEDEAVKKAMRGPSGPLADD